MKVMRISLKFAINHVSETPFRARNRLPVSRGRISHRQFILVAGWIIHRIAVSAIRSQQNVSQGHIVALLLRREVGPHQSIDFLSLCIMRNWRGETQVFALGGKIKLPSYPRDSVSLAHEKAVAKL